MPILDSQTKKELVRLLRSRAKPDVDWISKVTDTENTVIIPILREIAHHLDLERSIHRSLELTGRTYYAQFPAPLELYAITRILQPQHIIESGVSSGISSAHFLMALKANRKGRLHSIDLPQYQKAEKRSRGELSWSIPLGRDSGWAVPKRLRKNWDLRKGKSEDILPTLLDEIPSIDLFCHDSPWTPEHLAFELATIQSKLHSGSVIVADNTDANPRAVMELASAFAAKVHRRGHSNLIGIYIP